MIRGLALMAVLMIVIVKSEVIEKISEPSQEKLEASQFALVVSGQESSNGEQSELGQEGQSEVVVRAKRYYGCGCCGCAAVTAASVAPCGYCGCGCG